MMRLTTLLATGAAVILTAVSGFAQPAPSPGTPHRGGQVVIGSIQEPNVLNPLLTNLTVSQEAFNLVLDALTKIDDKGSVVPFLARELPSVSTDGKTYTYRLRRDVKWHDGRPFTSADVVFTHNAMMDPKNRIIGRPSGFLNVESVRAPDAYTVVFTLKEPQAPWIYTWTSLGILPRHVLEGRDLNTASWNTAPTVGLGPFVFVEWVSGSHILVRRNSDYYLGAPNVAVVVYRIIPDSNALLAAMEKGDIDMRFATTAEQVPIIERNPGWKVWRTPAYSVFHFTINNAHPIMSDRRVRQALTHALDKKGITQTILRGLVEPAWTPITTPSWAHDSAVVKFEYDPGKARQLLDEAGWRLNPASGVREKDGQRLAFSIVSIAGDVERQQIVQIAQRQWREVGAAVDVSLVDVGTFVTIMQSGNFAIGYGFWGAGPDPDSMLFTWWHSKGNNWLRLRLPQLDALIDDARVIQDRRKRRDLYLRAQKLIAQEATNIFLYERVFFDATKTRVNGFRPVAGGGVNTWNAHEWWVGR